MSQVQAAIPTQPRAKQLRACLLCSIIQTPTDFRKHGCPNCEELMQVRLSHPRWKDYFSCRITSQMKGYPDRIQSCTTTHFEGVISVINPEDSWVARWQRTCACITGSLRGPRADPFAVAKYVRGMYAVRVKGRIPEDVEAELENRNIKYRPRDGTDQD